MGQASTSPGVIMKCRFIIPSSEIFGNYIKYMDRDEAIHGGAIRQGYSAYMEMYMGNPEKTTGLFTQQQDSITKDSADKMKACFEGAQKKGSPMWQTVISFDNSWLQEQGLYDPGAGTLDEKKVKDAARKAMCEMMKREGMEQALWTGAIHYNTDNIHVHVAVVDYVGEREKITEGKYAGQTRGKWKPRTLWQGKSAVVNDLMDMSYENTLINYLIRDCIVTPLRAEQIGTSRLSGQLEALLHELEANEPDMRNWNYSSKEMQRFRAQIDAITDTWIKEEHPDDYTQLQQTLERAEQKQRRAYGGTKSGNRYREWQEQDLYKRCGNATLTVLRDCGKDRRQSAEKERKERSRKPQKGRHIGPQPVYALQQAFQKEWKHYRNLAVYRQQEKEAQEEQQEELEQQ